MLKIDAPMASDTALAALSDRRRKTPTGTSGCRASRASISANAPSMVMPAARVEIARAEPHGCVPVPTMP